MERDEINADAVFQGQPGVNSILEVLSAYEEEDIEALSDLIQDGQGMRIEIGPSQTDPNPTERANVIVRMIRRYYPDLGAYRNGDSIAVYLSSRISAGPYLRRPTYPYMPTRFSSKTSLQAMMDYMGDGSCMEWDPLNFQLRVNFMTSLPPYIIQATDEEQACHRVLSDYRQRYRGPCHFCAQILTSACISCPHTDIVFRRIMLRRAEHDLEVDLRYDSFMWRHIYGPVELECRHCCDIQARAQSHPFSVDCTCMFCRLAFGPCRILVFPVLGRSLQRR